ncbi:hypothetical protein PQR05_36425 [Paraburkholderia sediminicola]|uniref:hypothetical protein n=1 Tax=Paraburkholderia sediminicola TaxID=458836 RepID=UPI0038B9C537
MPTSQKVDVASLLASPLAMAFALANLQMQVSLSSTIRGHEQLEAIREQKAGLIDQQNEIRLSRHEKFEKSQRFELFSRIARLWMEIQGALGDTVLGVLQGITGDWVQSGATLTAAGLEFSMMGLEIAAIADPANAKSYEQKERAIAWAELGVALVGCAIGAIVMAKIVVAAFETGAALGSGAGRAAQMVSEASRGAGAGSGAAAVTESIKKSEQLVGEATLALEQAQTGLAVGGEAVAAQPGRLEADAIEQVVTKAAEQRITIANSSRPAFAEDTVRTIMREIMAEAKNADPEGYLSEKGLRQISRRLISRLIKEASKGPASRAFLARTTAHVEENALDSGISFKHSEYQYDLQLTELEIKRREIALTMLTGLQKMLVLELNRTVDFYQQATRAAGNTISNSGRLAKVINEGI